MLQTRRTFLKHTLILGAAFLTPVKSRAAEIAVKSIAALESAFDKIKNIILSLKEEGSNLVMKVLNGRKLIRDPEVRYPNDEGIADYATGNRIFFHSHRENEYGHFHVFYKKENGDFVHLLLISMNKDGEPIELATVNGWVTGDKYYEADELKKYFDIFSFNPESYPEEKRIVKFVNNTFEAYRDMIFKLYDERDEWIMNYVNQYYREPFEDRGFDILSSRKISVL